MVSVSHDHETMSPMGQVTQVEAPEGYSPFQQVWWNLIAVLVEIYWFKFVMFSCKTKLLFYQVWGRRHFSNEDMFLVCHLIFT